MYSSLFTNKTSVTGQQLALWLLTDLLLSRFLEDLTSLPSDGFLCYKIILQSFIKQHNVWFPCRFGIYSYISSTISGLDYCTCLSYLVLGFVYLINRTRSLRDKSQSQFLTSKKLAHCSTRAKSWLIVLHRTKSIANIPAKTVSN